jgi:hypothetical protein
MLPKWQPFSFSLVTLEAKQDYFKRSCGQYFRRVSGQFTRTDARTKSFAITLHSSSCVAIQIEGNLLENGTL